MGRVVKRPMVEGVGEKPTTVKPLPAGVVRTADGRYVKASGESADGPKIDEEKRVNG